MKLYYFIYAIFALLFTNNLTAQDMDFTQWQSNYNALNPAMTGISNNPKLQIAYRLRPAWFSGNSNNSGFSNTKMLCYDQRISPKGGYIGINYLNDIVGQADLNTQAINLQYARSYTLNMASKNQVKDAETDKNMHIRFGFSIGGFQRTIDGSMLQEAAKVNPRTGTVYESHSQLSSGKLITSIKPNFGVGTSLSYNIFYGGFAVHNIIRPMDAFVGSSASRFPRRYSANAGAFIRLNKGKESTTIVSPYVIFQKQYIFTEILPGVNINKGILTGGISYRHTNPNFKSINFIAGISKGRFKAGYNFDYVLNSVFLNMHELSLSVYLGKTRDDSKKGLPYYFRKMGF